ncbi:MAG TPA: response regulator transcription factor [Burkholderiales bacterium]|nr:response regulator transcription factor [Burkholderiales bacterium]
MLAVDDHPLMRSALRELIGLIAEHVELLEAPDPLQALAILERRRDVDLVLLDLNFSGHSGLDFIQRFRAISPATPIIVYTMHEDTAILKQALAHGAVGIVPKTHSAKHLQKAIEVVMDAGVYLPPELARQLASPEPASATTLNVSDQQRRILELLARGLPNKVIAKELGVAPSTVKNQLTVIFGKLGVSNRTQAAIAARGIVKSKPSSP